MTSVLVVDDDTYLLRALRITLQAHGYDVATAADGRSALLAAQQQPPALVILDLGLPDMDGSAVLRKLRGWSAVPVLVLSARHGSEDKVEALDAGADDYITKPFGLDELLARLRALLRRSAETEQPAVVTTEAFTVDLGKRRVLRDGQDIRLLRPNGRCWRCWSGARRNSSPSSSSSPRCGVRPTPRRPTICASTWPSSGASWNPRPPPRGT